ncbi:MAG: DUF3179 domain-containing protein [Pseudomonadota bacterium]
MRFTRRCALSQMGAATAGLTLAPTAALPQAETLGIDRAVEALIFGIDARRDAALEAIEAHGNVDIMPSLIMALRFSRGAGRPLNAVMQDLTGERGRDDWFQWMLWQQAHAEVVPHPSYVELKRTVYRAIDPNFEIFLRPEHLQPERMRIRLEEITWGGVRKDGIPSLDNPELLAAADASYLRDDDLVFGVSINGDARAYPLRIMGWHEMFNEVIGDVPVALAYCTLCGAGILFETQVAGREKPFVFGSSGFLYRSNKLMFDRETHSLWNQFTGEPVMGPLVDSGIVLGQRPVTIEPWSAWRARNPETRVLSLETGHRRDYGSGVVYREYFASDDLMFPALVDQAQLQQKDYVFGIRTFGAAKAWPIEVFAGGRVINDAVGDLNVVLIGDAAGRTVRAYDRGARQFTAGSTPSELRADGASWQVAEEALTGPGGATAPRVAGHIAYWFAWDGYLGARSDLYQG